MNNTLSDSQLEAMIKSAVNSSGPLPPDEKFSQLVSALRELQERRKAAMDGEPVAVVPEDVRQALSKMDDEIIAELDAEESGSRATMDSEPVAWTWHYREKWHVTNDERRAEFVAKDGDVAVLPLYRHAQSAQISEPVLPLQDKDLQGVIDALEHPAGINAAGKQVVRHALVEIQERRKADREPVAEVVSIYGDPEAFGEREIRPLVGIQQMPYGTKLYRHAQPAPVVPEEMTIRDACKFVQDMRLFDDVSVIVMRTWNACRAAMLQGADGKPHLTVWYGSMPETNGKTNWTAILHRKGECLSTGITVCRSEYPDRVRYEADRMRHLIGDLADEPNILAYDADAHGGYVPPAAPQSPGRDTATVPGKWIPVSERIPIPGVDVLVAKEFFGPGDWRRKVGHVRHEESGWNIYGASWEPTHWMPLPAAPQEVK